MRHLGSVMRHLGDGAGSHDSKAIRDLRDDSWDDSIPDVAPLAPARAPLAPATLGPVAASPRAVMLGHLYADMGAALAVGDLEAARIAHDAIGRLLAAMRSGDGPGDGAPVLDLAADRWSATRGGPCS